MLYLLFGFIKIISFLLSVLYLSTEIYEMIKYSKYKLKTVLPIGISLIGFINIVFNPFQIDSEKLESPIVVNGYYSGTVSYATIKFRSNNKFELSYWGGFGAKDYYDGKWNRKNDTLELNWGDYGKPLKMNNILIIEDKLIVTTAQDYYYPPFYVIQNQTQ